MRNFLFLLRKLWSQGKFVCVGLDTDYNKIPQHLRENSLRETDAILSFNKAIIDATKDLVCCYKPNFAFYERYGAYGIRALRNTILYINEFAPEVPVIVDAKRADIDNTNLGSVEGIFRYLKADAITVHPYLGGDALKPFLNCKEKGIIILCKTSNTGSSEFQNLPVTVDADTRTTKLVYEIVAEKVADYWNTNSNCLLVVGATYPEELKKVRSIVGSMPILIPGIGAQGGDLEKTLEAGLDSTGEGVIINSSRGIIFASGGEDFAEAAQRETKKLHDAISAYRKKHFPVMV